MKAKSQLVRAGSAVQTVAGVGFSDDADSRRAGHDAVEAAINASGRTDAAVALTFCTSRHDPEELILGAKSALPPAAHLVGGFSVGAMSAEHLGYGGCEAAAAVLSTGDVELHPVLATGLAADEEATGAEPGRKVRSIAPAGAPDMLLLYDSVKKTLPKGFILNHAVPMLAGLRAELGDLSRVAGAGLMGDFQGSPTSVWVDSKPQAQAAIGLVLGGLARLHSVVIHGCEPMGSYHRVTRAEGDTVFEIDGMPALDFMNGVVSAYSPLPFEEYPLAATLGVNNGDRFGPFKPEDYINQLCMFADPETKALHMFEPYLATGMEIQLMRRRIPFEYVAERVETLFDEIGEARPVLAIYLDCAGRASALSQTDGEDAAAVRDAVAGRVPLLGLYTGVEIAAVAGVVSPLDYTGVLCLITAEAAPGGG